MSVNYEQSVKDLLAEFDRPNLRASVKYYRHHILTDVLHLVEWHGKCSPSVPDITGNNVRTMLRHLLNIVEDRILSMTVDELSWDFSLREVFETLLQNHAARACLMDDTNRNNQAKLILAGAKWYRSKGRQLPKIVARSETHQIYIGRIHHAIECLVSLLLICSDEPHLSSIYRKSRIRDRKSVV